MNITLKNDGSTITVSADSVDEAIKKIHEQITVLKSKSPLDQKDKAQQAALEQAAKELGQLVKSSKNAVIKLDGNNGSGGFTTTRHVVTTQSQDAKLRKTQTPEQKAEIDKIRSRIKELRQELTASQRKLVELEGGNVSYMVVDRNAVIAGAPCGSRLRRKLTPSRSPEAKRQRCPTINRVRERRESGR